jgi:hypothetical protein
LTDSKRETNKILNGQVTNVGVNAQVNTVSHIAGVVSAQSVGEIRRDIVSGAKVQQVKNQIPKPKDSH